MKDMHWYLTNNALVPPIYNLYFYLFIYFLVDVLKFLSQSPHKLISNAHTHSPHHPYLTLPKCPTKTSAFANPRTPFPLSSIWTHCSHKGLLMLYLTKVHQSFFISFHFRIRHCPAPMSLRDHPLVSLSSSGPINQLSCMLYKYK